MSDWVINLNHSTDILHGLHGKNPIQSFLELKRINNKKKYSNEIRINILNLKNDPRTDKYNWVHCCVTEQYCLLFICVIIKTIIIYWPHLCHENSLTLLLWQIILWHIKLKKTATCILKASSHCTISVPAIWSKVLAPLSNKSNGKPWWGERFSATN